MIFKQINFNNQSIFIGVILQKISTRTFILIRLWPHIWKQMLIFWIFNILKKFFFALKHLNRISFLYVFNCKVTVSRKVTRRPPITSSILHPISPTTLPHTPHFFWQGQVVYWALSSSLRVFTIGNTCSTMRALTRWITSALWLRLVCYCSAGKKDYAFDVDM